MNTFKIGETKAARYFPIVTNRFSVEYLLPAPKNSGSSVDTYAFLVLKNKETGQQIELPVSFPLDDQTLGNTLDLFL